MKAHLAIAALLICGMPLAGASIGLAQTELIAISVLAAIGWYASALASLHKMQAPTPASSQDRGITAISKPEPEPVEDCRFGRIYTTEKGNERYLSLSDVVAIAAQETTTTFTAHLARLLASQPGRAIVLMGETSYPDFDSLLEKLPTDIIGRVVIRARTDMNSSVKATLECTLHTIHGTVHVRPHWTAWKPTREEEIITTLLVPLSERSLLGNARIEKEGREHPLPGSLTEIIEDVLRLSGYPYQRYNANDDRMSQYLRALIAAQETAR